jgi:hypothetical protein
MMDLLSKLRLHMSTLAHETRKEKIVEWIAAGDYGVAVEVEATFFSERPGEPYLTPQTVRFLEQVAKDAEAGDIESLRKAGQVFVQLSKAA